MPSRDYCKNSINICKTCAAYLFKSRININLTRPGMLRVALEIAGDEALAI